jgi:L-arabinokinase
LNLKSAMRIVYYISGHGFGHTSRSIELIGALTALRPDLQIVVRAAAHRWFFDDIRGPGVEVQPLDADTGVVQIDSLTLDEDETARRAAVFYGDFDRRVDAEADDLARRGASLVIADIPPLALAAARLAGIPSIAVGNFTWDWIYAYYPGFERMAPGVISIISRAYGAADLALRLPVHGGFESMAAVTTDLPFIARRSVRDPADTRRLLGVGGRGPVVLASFGGYGLDLPYDRIAQSGLTVLTPPQHPPAGLRYEDLVAAADVVVSKPGYGIVSECAANDTALLYTSRGPFAEYDVMLEEMPRMLRCRYLAQADLVAGHWRKAIEALLDQPHPAERPRVDGASVAAALVLERFSDSADRSSRSA